MGVGGEGQEGGDMGMYMLGKHTDKTPTHPPARHHSNRVRELFYNRRSW